MKGQVKKIIFFEGGFPVFRSLSNLVADRLGQFLVRAGKIDEETLKQAAEQAARTRQRTGDVLIRLGALEEEERPLTTRAADQEHPVLRCRLGGGHLHPLVPGPGPEGSDQARHPPGQPDHARREEALQAGAAPAADAARGAPHPQPGSLLQPQRRGAAGVGGNTYYPRCDGGRSVSELGEGRRQAGETRVSGRLVALTSLRVLELRLTWAWDVCRLDTLGAARQ